ncbi:hypothetical protein WAF17_05125 [Bernardetia sp. ABR2-2B]|uniref:hypothetical protein n=1 Tax=Bernardetia sp. ABR2-2B TaxID=3127472 RepID=UPI0030CE5C65
MQKLDFVKNLEIIVSNLESSAIISYFQAGGKAKGANYDFSPINLHLFRSKSNYDNISNNVELNEILDALEASTLYNESNLSQLTTIFRNTQFHNLVANPLAFSFYNFHNTLLSMLKLAKKVLLTSLLEKNYDDYIEEGIIVFQTVIDTDGLKTETYAKIFTALADLVEVLSILNGEQEQESKIILLDSGSNTNTAIKTGIETAKSLFSIFKEVWDFTVNHKYYKASQTNKVILESLTTREEINKKVANGTITEDEAKQYQHLIKTRTNELIKLKTLPKQIVVENNQIENRKLLKEFDSTKTLTEGKKDDDIE